MGNETDREGVEREWAMRLIERVWGTNTHIEIHVSQISIH